MKAIVIYYSLEGNTKYVADKIAKIMKADVLRLKPVKPYPTGAFSKYFWGGRSVIFGHKPQLMPYDFNKEDYDIVIIGSPVWAGSFTPPVKSFFNEQDIKGRKVGFFACSAGGHAEGCLKKMKEAAGITEEVPTLSLIDPAKKLAEEDVKGIEAFCSQLLSRF